MRFSGDGGKFDAARDAVAFLAVLAAAVLYNSSVEMQREMDEIRMSELNITGRLDGDGLIFNRVPKVGSEMIWALIDHLAVRNNFSSYSDSKDVKDKRGGENNFIPRREGREHYVEIFVRNMTKPFSYVKHLNFIDMTEFNLTNHIYVNFVRDPVERVISWYYYHRAPWHILRVDENNQTDLHSRVPSLKSLKTSFEECYTTQGNECIYRPGQGIFQGYYGGSHFSQMSFYCGHGPECTRFEQPELLAKAKENVEKYFAVVGVLEWLDESLEVLEAYVPKYFRGARETYAGMRKWLQEKNTNIYKPRTPQWIKDDMARNFTLEFDFFEFCKQRLRKQYLAIQ